MIRKVHSLKKYNGRCNNDGIHHLSRAFITHPQVLGNLRHAAKLDAVPIHPRACHCMPPLLGAQLLYLSLVPERHSLSLFMLLGFLIFGAGEVFFAASLNCPTQSGVP